MSSASSVFAQADAASKPRMSKVGRVLCLTRRIRKAASVPVRIAEIMRRKRDRGQGCRCYGQCINLKCELA